MAIAFLPAGFVFSPSPKNELDVKGERGLKRALEERTNWRFRLTHPLPLGRGWVEGLRICAYIKSIDNVFF